MLTEKLWAAASAEATGLGKASRIQSTARHKVNSLRRYQRLLQLSIFVQTCRRVLLSIFGIGSPDGQTFVECGARDGISAITDPSQVLTLTNIQYNWFEDSSVRPRPVQVTSKG